MVINNDEPFILLDSRTQPAFRNADDEKSDRDYDRALLPPPPAAPTQTQLLAYWHTMLTRDLNDNNLEGEAPTPAFPLGETTSAATYNERNHRVDLFSFFARDRYYRQTGNDAVASPGAPSPPAPASYAADESSNEAWVV